MGIFSIKWWKDQIKDAVKVALEEKEKEEKGMEKLVDSFKKDPPITFVSEKPYKNLMYINGYLTVFFQDGDTIGNIVDVETFNKVKEAKNIEEVTFLLTSEKRKEEIKEEKKIESNIQILLDSGDFELKENSVYMKGINRSIPELLLNRFASVLDKSVLATGLLSDIEEQDEYIALKRFWMWCCLNPRAEVADKLYDFLYKNGMKINKQGMFIALRNVVTTENADGELVDFITNVYHKIKAIWKKKPSDYSIYNDGSGYTFIHKDKQNHGENKYIGNVQDLYLDLPNLQGNRYTDDWTHTFDIRIGQKVSMPLEECNWSTQDCASAGLHFAGHTAPYVLCGNTTIFTLHNPMKVVGIGTEKGRCWEYLPFMTTTVEEADEIMNSEDFDFLQLDEQYAIDELKDLEEKVKHGFSVEAKKYTFNISSISSQEIHNICKSLETIQETIENRVVDFENKIYEDEQY